MSCPRIPRDQPRNSCCRRGKLKKRPDGGTVNFLVAQKSIIAQENYRNYNAAKLLREEIHLVGPTGERSDLAAFETATQICCADLLSPIFVMKQIHRWLDDQTPLEGAEQSEECSVIDMIGAIEAGDYN